MNLILLITAFTLSSIAAYYSIAGLVAIFAASVVPVIVMGAVLEFSKIVVTSWTYRNWDTANKILRTYFVGAILALMLLTSMGIYGFLSKAHSDQNLVSGDVIAKLEIIDEKIKTEKENIDANRKIIIQLDSQVDQLLARSTTDSGADRSAGLRSRQAKERKAAQEEILSSQAKVSKLNQERAPIAAENRKVEAEVGPIKYIAQLVYGQAATGQDTLESAVRWIIILIVSVFDPLAVGMFIAYNQSVRPVKKKIESRKDTPALDTLDLDKDTPALDTLDPEPVAIPKPTHAPMKKRKKKIEWERDRVLIPVDQDE